MVVVVAHWNLETVAPPGQTSSEDMGESYRISALLTTDSETVIFHIFVLKNLKRDGVGDYATDMHYLECSGMC